MYSKIFTQIFDSSIADDWKVRHVFEDLLKLCDQDGIVDMTPEAIQARTRLPINMVRAGLAALEKPDARSRTHDQEGRRIVCIDPQRGWGWQIVNYKKYRRITSAAERHDSSFGDASFGRFLNDANGYVYYIRDGKLVKIGWSKNPWARLNEIKTSNPNAKILAVERGSMTLEKERQEQFKGYRFSREWFKLEGELSDFVATVSTTKSVVGTTATTSASASASASASVPDPVLPLDLNKEVQVQPKEPKRPTLEELKLICAKMAVSKEDAEALWHKWQGNGWRNGGQPIKSVSHTIAAWKAQGYLPSQRRSADSKQKDFNPSPELLH